MENRNFRCELCKCDAGSEANLVSHLNGIKHKKKLKALGIDPEKALENKITPPVVVQNTNNQKRNKSETDKETNVAKKNLDLNSAKIKEIVTSKSTFSEMMEKLMTELQLPVHIMNEKYNTLCNDLQMVLSRRFRNCRVYPFGSTITGLGFKTSDLDVFVDVKRNTLPPDLKDKDASEFTKISRRVLYSSNLFSKIIAIPHAKTPIVKCVHDPTGVNCDFNFKSMLGVCNSRLIKFLISNNRGLLGAMIILKCWAKFHDISGTGKFTNYTLSMMFIFYLQINHYLPSVFSLQLKNEHAFIQEGWNGGFCNDINLLPKIDTPIEILIPQLLLGFFKYYSSFDYALNVICPLVGKVVSKSSFNHLENLPSEMVFYKQVVTKLNDKPLNISSSICVQDPFVLIHNITSYITPKLLQEFQNLCERSWKVIESVQDEPHKIFHKLFFVVQKPKASNFEMPNVEMCTFKIPFTTSTLPTPNASISELSKAWFENLHQFLISVLSKIFLFELTAKREYVPKKFMKVEGKTDIHNNDIFDTTTFHCIGNINTWDGRKNIAKGYDATNDNKIQHSTTLDREIAISEYLLKVVNDNNKNPTPIVDFDFNITAKLNPIEAKFTLTNIKSNKNIFKTMATNLGLLIPTCFDKYLKESSNNELVQNNKTENIVDKIESKNSTITANNSNNSLFENDKLETRPNEPNSEISVNKFLESIEKIQNVN